jgi:hypothetical protein
VCGLTLATAGSLPDLSRTTEVGRLFVVDGLGALPTPVFGLHVVVYLTFVAAFVAGLLSGWPQHRSATTTPVLRGMLAYSGVLGLGGLSVWAGRSHPLALSGVFPIWAFATVLLVWLLVQSITHAAALSPSVVVAWLAPALLLVTTFGVMVATLSEYPAPWTQISRIAGDTSRPIDGYGGDTELQCFFAQHPKGCAPLLTKADRASAVRFVARYTAKGDRVLILATAGHVIARESGVINVSPYGYPDLILSAAQMRSVLNDLHENDGAKVFVGSTWPEIPAYLARHGFERKIRDPKSGLVEWELRQT